MTICISYFVLPALFSADQPAVAPYLVRGSEETIDLRCFGAEDY
jgi:hypothetical protein